MTSRPTATNMRGSWMAEPRLTSQPTEAILQNTAPLRPDWSTESTYMQWAWGQSICKSRHITDTAQELAHALSHCTRHSTCQICHTMGHKSLGCSANALPTLCKRATCLPSSHPQSHQSSILEIFILYWTITQIEICTPYTPRSSTTPFSQKSPWQQQCHLPSNYQDHYGTNAWGTYQPTDWTKRKRSQRASRSSALHAPRRVTHAQLQNQ